MQKGDIYNMKLDPETRQLLDALAKKTDRPRASVIRQLIQMAVRSEETQRVLSQPGPAWQKTHEPH